MGLPVSIEENGAPSRGTNFGKICRSKYSIGCYVVLALTLFILLMVSITDVPPLHYGLKHNTATKTVSRDVYDAGRYFIAPWESFLLFPSNARNMDFTDSVETPMGYIALGGPLKLRTADALSVSLHFSVQYQLQKDNVYKLYNAHNTFYEDNIFVSEIRDVLEDLVGNLNAKALWEERVSKANEMQTKMQEALNKQFADCVGVQFLIIDLPKNLENQMIATQVEKQLIEIRQFEQEATIVRTETQVIESKTEQEIIEIKAQTDADITDIQSKAETNITEVTFGTRTEETAYVQTKLNLTASQLHTYQKLDMQLHQKHAALVMNFESASIRVGPGS